MAGTSSRKPLVAESKPLEPVVAAAAAAARVRGLLLGGASFASLELVDFLCFEIRDGDSAASSVDASREEGCKRSVVEDLRRSEAIWVVRFRLAEELVEEGDDMGDMLGRYERSRCTIYRVVSISRPNRNIGGNNREVQSEAIVGIRQYLRSTALAMVVGEEVGRRSAGSLLVEKRWEPRRERHPSSHSVVICGNYSTIP